MITVETERVTVVSRNGQRAVGWCERCGAMVELLSDAEVLARAQLSLGRGTREGILPRELHAAETPEGMLLICPKSLGEEQGLPEETSNEQRSGKP